MFCPGKWNWHGQYEHPENIDLVSLPARAGPAECDVATMRLTVSALRASGHNKSHFVCHNQNVAIHLIGYNRFQTESHLKASRALNTVSVLLILSGAWMLSYSGLCCQLNFQPLSKYVFTHVSTSIIYMSLDSNTSHWGFFFSSSRYPSGFKLMKCGAPKKWLQKALTSHGSHGVMIDRPFDPSCVEAGGWVWVKVVER